MEALPYLAVLLSGLLLMTVGRYIHQKARVLLNKQIGRAMIFVGSIMTASILFFFAFVSAFGG
ncbi:MAG: hypothetical protein A2418_00325 [Candidatus Brennerbacteria bacterium RIFOXYC1_FULL_41_11]|uniref:Uncharacterized protein n=1 Tax=Candidatus Brennerbacteria bacterium RIFOXYD1_FULL_41_16 TaxID=1797529 RepID=A0A1G1XKW2_9BACT|nr:MAG: hypothetical protein UU61_C0005G0014 [Parcubacteria group bacterium GW2011_GWB1_41_4]OGY39280.1 MAG: hypothetical protein A2391_01785 [Candidatus Brennerbacteria bacterium RIFOXYB1_FULL_41_13]OGY39682.1 MAG: hypothetical protein A2418_00325 [Candidatus Brennerbacteria bacterium RIFOXYC1_FULL_41_11]OGY40306.1 MAG: hypothetical protein A2570_03450 [Candidatus Brennerbacteria bacterium RIFOXYD1_FULL_41_16]